MRQCMLFLWAKRCDNKLIRARIMLIDLYERPNTPEAPISRAFIDQIFSLSGPDGGVVGGEDGITTARPLKDGGREAWDMMRRLREKAWQKAGLDPKVLWTDQALAQAQAEAQNQGQGQGLAQTGGLRHSNSRGSSGLSPGGSSVVKDPNSSPTNFADSYYAMIKEPYEHRQHTRRVSAESERLKGALRTDTGRPNNTMPHQLGNMWPTSIPESTPMSARLATDPTHGGWPCTPSFPGMNTLTTEYQQLHNTAVSTGEMPNYYDTPNEFSHNHHAPPHQHAHNAPIATPSPSSKIHNGHHLHHQLSPNNPSLSPFASTGLNHGVGNGAGSGPTQARPQSLDANLNFDWDQWDAVFGQYLPVVDGFMDLDNSPLDSHTRGQRHGGSNSGSGAGEVPLAGLPMVPGEMGTDDAASAAVATAAMGGGNMRNWADFG